MKKKDINAIMATVTLLVLFKTLLWGEEEVDLEDFAHNDFEAEGVSDIENEFFQSDVIEEGDEEESQEEIEQDEEFMEWLQSVVHKMNEGFDVLAELMEEEIAITEEPLAEAASDSDSPF